VQAYREALNITLTRTTDILDDMLQENENRRYYTATLIKTCHLLQIMMTGLSKPTTILKNLRGQSPTSTFSLSISNCCRRIICFQAKRGAREARELEIHRCGQESDAPRSTQERAFLSRQERQSSDICGKRACKVRER
jgi:hypothetical protein